jgi:ectoine hydroxylase-related dioxygenase (phytanoyl-CoA dioxygenase family)
LRRPQPLKTDTVRLTPEQIHLFDIHGHLSIESITTVEEILEIKAIIEKLFEDRTGENEGAYSELIGGDSRSSEVNSPQILNLVNYAPSLHKTKCFLTALQIAKQLLGHDAHFFSDLSIFKAAKIGAGTPWHQDAAYRDPRFVYKDLTIWVPLQEVNAETGCMQFISGSHRKAVLEHSPANNDLASQALQCTAPIDESSAVVCPLPAGGCTIHHSALLHSSGPNVSDKPRLTYIMIFSITPQLAEKAQEFPWFSQRQTLAQIRKRRWMRRGGVLVTAWRRLRRGELSSWRSVIYWTKRCMRTVLKGA